MNDPWPLESRRAMMREVVAKLASRGLLPRLQADAAAQTYGVLEAEVTAEMMKYPQEDCGK